MLNIDGIPRAQGRILTASFSGVSSPFFLRDLLIVRGIPCVQRAFPVGEINGGRLLLAAARVTTTAVALVAAVHFASIAAFPSSSISLASAPHSFLQRAPEMAPSSSASASLGPAKNKRTAIVWFRKDLRLRDNPALFHAAQSFGSIVPVFVWSPEEEKGCVPGAAARAWITEGLEGLNHSLIQRFRCPLVLRMAPKAADALGKIMEESGATAIFYNRVYEPLLMARDRQLERQLKSRFPRVSFSSFSGYLLYEPAAVDVPCGFNGGHWGTLMPYVRATKKLPQPPRPLPIPRTICPHPYITEISSSTPWRDFKVILGKDGNGFHLDDCSLKWGGPRNVWASNMLDAWRGVSTTPAGSDNGKGDSKKRTNKKIQHQAITSHSSVSPASEEAAQERLALFLARKLGNYEKSRSRADVHTKSASGESPVSTLSPYLRWGQLSCRQLYWSVRDIQTSKTLPREKLKTFSRRLFWRDLAYFHFQAFPRMQTEPIRAHYAQHPWEGERDPSLLRAWQRGRTGYPIVDAAMRELWATGWMQQSVRMVAASLLVEYLGINWERGREWFADTLVDEDAAINAMMWQNAGRSGIDQWNFVLDPGSGAQDPTGSYVRRWLPELRGLPKKYLHRPWSADANTLRSAGVVLGRTYPHRIVTDLKAARKQTVEGLRRLRERHSDSIDANGYDIISLPNGQRTRVFTRKEFRGGGRTTMMNAGSSGRRLKKGKGAQSKNDRWKKSTQRLKLKRARRGGASMPIPSPSIASLKNVGGSAGKNLKQTKLEFLLASNNADAKTASFGRERLKGASSGCRKTTFESLSTTSRRKTDAKDPLLENVGVGAHSHRCQNSQLSSKPRMGKSKQIRPKGRTTVSHIRDFFHAA